jgi:hypothetical protein
VKELARAVTMALFAAATVVWAADRENQARFVADVEQASREVRALGEAVRAGVHASHPIQQLGQRVFGPIKAADPALGERAHSLLKQVGRADPAFQARVRRHLVDAIAEEYEERSRKASSGRAARTP